MSEDYDRYCDLTMRGGTTSGVIYPLAACALARHYEFKSIGGASAGAIAAAFTAAAEHGRASGGFAKLAAIIDWFTSGKGAERWRLAQLFQPGDRTRALYRIVVATMQRRETTGRSAFSCLFFALFGAIGLRAKAALGLMALLWLGGPALWCLALASNRWENWLSIIVITVAVTSVPLVLWRIRRLLPWQAWLFSLIPLVLAVLTGVDHIATAAVAVLWWLVLSFAALAALVVTYGLAAQRFLKNNATAIHFGLVPGTGAFKPNVWDRLAGVPKSTGVPPLSDWLADQLDDLAGTSHALTFGDLRKVSLVLMTTDVSEGRPYRLPFSDPKIEWHYCERCLGHVLPQRVVKQMEMPATGQECPLHSGTALRPLPPNEKLPIVLAVRMSLSCPGLIASVPLCRNGRMHWFSDGGITSNFPIHFFDSLLPRWPTFGLSLQSYPEDDPDEIWLPEQDGSASGAPWARMDGFPAFLNGILNTFLGWRDTMQSALPGFRGRIAHVRQAADEGGTNLFMPPATILKIAKRGERAGQMLHDRFVQQPETDRYRWIRMRIAMREYRALGGDAAERADLYDELTRRFQIPAELNEWFRTPPDGTDPHAAEIRATIDALGDLVSSGPLRQPFDGAPPVDPDLRLTPPE